MDADITLMPDGRYCMMYMSQTGMNGVEKTVSLNKHRTMSMSTRFRRQGARVYKAPSIGKCIDEDKWVLMYDSFSLRPSNFGLAEMLLHRS